jgi:ATP adenylyltransferase
MKFAQLKDYLSRKMLMQHVYQPLMIKTLLESKENRASVETIARQFLVNDEPQLQYYKYITKVMPGRVLRSHNVVRLESGEFILNVDRDLTTPQKRELVALCDSKIAGYEQKYGRQSIWHSRFAGAKEISGPLRFQVIKRAKGRCELCGISKDLKALQVDHIRPQSRDGRTVLENLQALCYTCNAQKMDKDHTDFRGWSKMYEKREKGCPFCEIKPAIGNRNSLAFAFEDKYPVTEGHTLVSPIRHTPSFFDMGSSEQKACLMLLEQMKVKIAKKDSTITGFNVGVNDGKDAGQTVLHCHIHLIPRRKGDAADPRGGIRRIIPGRGVY